MKNDIFELEQKIMNCWSVVDDIDALYSHLGDNLRFVGMSPAAEDELQNILLGLKSVYQMKFEKLWDEFEGICREYHTLKNTRESFD